MKEEGEVLVEFVGVGMVSCFWEEFVGGLMG